MSKLSKEKGFKFCDVSPMHQQREDLSYKRLLMAVQRRGKLVHGMNVVKEIKSPKRGT
jgi:hypothetical protein